MADPAVLVINAGSSSLKFSAYRVRDGAPQRTVRGQIEGIHDRPRLVARDGGGASLAEQDLGAGARGHEACLAVLLDWLRDHGDAAELTAAGHRVAHGGTRFSGPVRVDAGVLANLEALSPLAPLHQPNNLAPIRALERVHPGLPQVACFDTGFHSDKPAVAGMFALPRDLTEAGIRRYGFHGLSYEYIAATLPAVAPEIADGRVVVAHLGSGASMCAMRGGRSVDSSMGFTALDGLPMGTRCGTLDPGVVLYLLRQEGMDADAVERLLYTDSGLKGVSGLSNDMRTLLASDDPRAAEAIDLFVYRIVQQLGALAATLGGLDGLVFTAGIGERAASIRARVITAAAWLGLELDATANEAGGPRITRAGSPVSAWAIPTNEELMIARHTLAVLGAAGREDAPEEIRHESAVAGKPGR